MRVRRGAQRRGAPASGSAAHVATAADARSGHGRGPQPTRHRAVWPRGMHEKQQAAADVSSHSTEPGAGDGAATEGSRTAQRSAHQTSVRAGTQEQAARNDQPHTENRREQTKRAHTKARQGGGSARSFERSRQGRAFCSAANTGSFHLTTVDVSVTAPSSPGAALSIAPQSRRRGRENSAPPARSRCVPRRVECCLRDSTARPLIDGSDGAPAQREGLRLDCRAGTIGRRSPVASV